MRQGEIARASRAVRRAGVGNIKKDVYCDYLLEEYEAARLRVAVLEDELSARAGAQSPTAIGRTSICGWFQLSAYPQALGRAAPVSGPPWLPYCTASSQQWSSKLLTSGDRPHVLCWHMPWKNIVDGAVALVSVRHVCVPIAMQRHSELGLWTITWGFLGLWLADRAPAQTTFQLWEINMAVDKSI